jgi:ABC-type Mn2+/Zn2+ transport system permease subunit
MDVIQFLSEPLALPFMQRAMLAAILIGIVSGVVGVYVVTRGMAFLGDALAHSILPGVAVAYLISGSGSGLLTGGLVAGILSSLGIGFLTRGGRLKEDTAIGIVFVGTLALGVGIISRTQNYAVDLTHILIGNILAVGDEDLLLILMVGLGVLLVVALFYKEMLIVSFDQTFAETLRLPGEGLRLLLLILLAVTVVIGVQVVGVTLVAAMLVTPAATARYFSKRLHLMMLISALVGTLSGVFGIYAAWYLRIAPSASIVLTMTVLFLLAFLLTPHKGYLWSLLGRSARTV